MIAGQGFNLHPLAAQDITAIWTFIAEDSPQAARRVRVEILEAVRAVVRFPHQGHRRPDLTSRPLRFTFSARISDRLRAGREASVGQR